MEQFAIETEFCRSSHFKDGLIDLTSGTMAGIANVYAGQPLDTVKVKMQAFPSLYKNGISCFKDTLRSDGVRGLYAGAVPALTANIAENAVLFTAYGYCQKMVSLTSGHSTVEEMSPAENAVAGSLASVFASLVLCPTELVKCRLQAQREIHPHSLSTPSSICREMIRKHGIQSFFVGLAPTLGREMPGYFFFFGAYEMSRSYFTRSGQAKNDIGILRTAVSGGIGGIALWTAVYPIDVIKSRMQIAGSGAFLHLLSGILKNEGVRVLYKGLAFTLMRAFWATGCLFVTYENVKKTLNSVF